MWARVARFEGDPAEIDGRLARLQERLDSGEPMLGLEGAKFLLLVDRATGGMMNVTLFESEEAMQRGDAAMNAGPGNAGTRTGVEFYEVPISIL
jgi:hypothetical protein